ncbi:hypothetical protein PG995_002914 [Apiospora arundinis]
MPSTVDFTDLPDIREQIADPPAQDILLMTDAIAKHRLDPTAWNSFDVLVMAVRQINRHLGQDDRLAGTNENEKTKEVYLKEEETNPILRLAWSRFETTFPSVNAQETAREAIKNKFWPSRMIPKFMGLLESAMMRKTLFGRHALLLFHPINIPVAKTAERSLVRWDCKNETIDDCIESHFGMFESPERRYWFRFNKPVVMRVHFQVRPEMFNHPSEHVSRHGLLHLRNATYPEVPSNNEQEQQQRQDFEEAFQQFNPEGAKR